MCVRVCACVCVCVFVLFACLLFALFVCCLVLLCVPFFVHPLLFPEATIRIGSKKGPKGK